MPSRLTKSEVNKQHTCVIAYKNPKISRYMKSKKKKEIRINK